jgi:hypothetical protein
VSARVYEEVVLVVEDSVICLMVGGVSFLDH